MKNRISELRKSRKITQSQLAKHLGIAQNTLSYWENGKFDIDNDSLHKIALYFDCSTDYILYRSDSPAVITFDKSAMSGLFAMPQSFYADLAQTITDNALETAFTDLCGDADDETIDLITELLHEVKAMSKDQIRQILKYAKFIKAE